MDKPPFKTIKQKQSVYFNQGKTLTLDGRLKSLEVLEQTIRRHEPAILAALNTDLGKCAFEGVLSEVGFLYDEIRFTRKRLGSWMRPEKVRTPLAIAFSRAEIVSEPLGSVLIIGPWNYPFQLVMSPLIGALAAGNCAVLKPSELAPATAKIISQIITEAFPDELVTVVTGGVDTSQALLTVAWNYLFFTGGAEVGKIVMQAAARNLTPLTLELGGKSPCIVDETANIKVAARRIAWGKFFNAGQTCVAPDYLLVHQAIARELLIALRDQIHVFFGDDPATSPDFGRIVNDRHFTRLMQLLADQPIAIGGTADAKQRYLAPTVLQNTDPRAKIMQEEIFGPILPVIEFSRLSEAIEFIKGQPKPLALYHFSESSTHQRSVQSQCSFGGGCINDTLVHLTSPKLPFGGVGPSGMGAYHGKHSFNTFSHRKSVVRRASWFDPSLRYPPYGDKLKMVRRVLGI